MTRKFFPIVLLAGGLVFAGDLLAECNGSDAVSRGNCADTAELHGRQEQARKNSASIDESASHIHDAGQFTPGFGVVGAKVKDISFKGLRFAVPVSLGKTDNSNLVLAWDLTYHTATHATYNNQKDTLRTDMFSLEYDMAFDKERWHAFELYGEAGYGRSSYRPVAEPTVSGKGLVYGAGIRLLEFLRIGYRRTPLQSDSVKELSVEIRLPL